MPFTSLDDPNGVAVDAAGDVYAADPVASRAVELPAGSSQQVTLPFTGLVDPTGVAVDAAGDAYAADPFSSRVVELPVLKIRPLRCLPRAVRRSPGRRSPTRLRSARRRAAAQWPSPTTAP